MKTLILFTVLCLSLNALADGTVTTPANVAPASWKIAAINMTTGATGDIPSVTIVIYWFDSTARILHSETQAIILTSSEITSFLATVESPVVGESGSVVKKYRQRVTAWLVANGKISNVTPE